MAWVVDTCLLIDVAEADPQFAAGSAALLEEKRSEGLVISPVTYAELAPVFDGNAARQELFLYNLEVSWSEVWRRRNDYSVKSAVRIGVENADRCRAALFFRG